MCNMKNVIKVFIYIMSGLSLYRVSKHKYNEMYEIFASRRTRCNIRHVGRLGQFGRISARPRGI